MVLKVTGSRNQPFSDIRKRALAQAGAKVAGRGPAKPDQTAFLGLSEAELTPAVQGAIRTLLTEIDDLRQEVGRLKAQLTRMEILADEDPLTPVLNRRALMRELERIRTFSRRYRSPAALVYLDLDDFKAVNDRFGHSAGDLALRAVADRLKSQMTEGDLVARVGGDEFAVILAQAGLHAAEVRARNLARSLEAAPVQFGEWSAPLHVSYGVSEIHPDVEGEDLLARADAAMYARRRERRA
ncbi:GGDEF domain-containing protein [Phenylobacterium sp.]|jgi:diguanylate cyclase (GGDEF)-like protein|uniref:GGDEF domain-containing protein n=1 Tax=Phenylobacterium sp. TaxID=1871053 RepID=UPI0025EE5FF6|nr:GGDEF domain-containing protein [Phenylobacterium sp.]MCA3720894.1 GGDEF domain-containing protein [Phenylobacterium sp.]